MDQTIEKYYKIYKYPNLERLYSYLKDDNVSVTKKQVKEFLSNQASKQITQQKKVFKKDGGHIVALAPDELWQIDIFYLPKYYKTNKGYKYIFCAIDVFTRHVFCIPLKNKDNIDIINALKTVFKMIYPQKIISDSDSVFTSKEFQKLLTEYDVIHETVPINDHPSLGIIDRFARTLKQRITDLFLGSGVNTWINDFDDIITDYNNSKNRGILNLKPIEASNPENIPLLVHLNYLKSLKNKMESDLNVGDKVRIFIKKDFDKGTEPAFSNEVYTIRHIRGKTIILNNGVNKRRNDLLLVPPDTEGSNKENIIKQQTRIYKQEQQLKREDQIPENLTREPRKGKGQNESLKKFENSEHSIIKKKK
jgi:transposase InsO family protein